MSTALYSLFSNCAPYPNKFFLFEQSKSSPLSKALASGNNWMDGAYSKEQGDPGNGIVVDTPMAAAASTLLYQLQYGGDDAPSHSKASNGKTASDHFGALDLCASSDNNMDYKTDGLVFSDDEDFLLSIVYDLEDEQL